MNPQPSCGRFSGGVIRYRPRDPPTGGGLFSATRDGDGQASRKLHRNAPKICLVSFSPACNDHRRIPRNACGLSFIFSPIGLQSLANVARELEIDFPAVRTKSSDDVPMAPLLTTAWSGTAIVRTNSLATFLVASRRGSAVRLTGLKLFPADVVYLALGHLSGRNLSYKKRECDESN
jgi:hypothetical protein